MSKKISTFSIIQPSWEPLQELTELSKIQMSPSTTSRELLEGDKPHPSTTTGRELKASRMALSHLTSVEDRALELATRPQRGVPLSADEKRVRRRLQYKLHQRRHRAKQSATILGLEAEIEKLHLDIQTLEHQREACLLANRSQDVFGARGTDAGAPVRVAMEYIRLFEYGYVKNSPQEQFVRAVMEPNVAGPDYQGIDTMMDQWRCYHAFFSHTRLEFKGVDVVTADKATIVTVDIVMTLRSRRQGLVALYPGLHGDEHVIQTLVDSALPISGSLRFSFGADGMCTWLGGDFDFVPALQRALGSLKTVAKCLEGAQVSFTTGQIKTDSVQQSQFMDSEQEHRGEEETLWVDDTIAWVAL